MPEGERAFVESHGPRTLVALRLSVEANAALRVAGAQVGLTKTGFATFLIEGWAQEWLDTKTPEETVDA